MYIKRHIEKVITEASRTFPAVIITGPRQVGKTTVLHECFPKANYTTLDHLDTLDAALNDPERFLDVQKKPTIVDEVQYAPKLFRYVKISIDKNRGSKGRFFLTGSQRYLMMQGVDESLAGRAGTIEMLGLSLREIERGSFYEPFMPSDHYVKARLKAPFKLSVSDIWNTIFIGDLPELHASPNMNTALYYESYIDTYLRRDVRGLAQVGDLSTFNRFMSIAAQRHGQLLNKADIASKSGVSVITVTRWLSVLEASNIIYLLKPFYANSNKRLVKTPKLYFLNSGLAAKLCGLSSARELEQSNQAGAFFEGFAIAEIIKSHLNASGSFPDLYFYRDSNRNEIDLLMLKGMDIYPIEIKMSTLARAGDTNAFKYLDELKGFTRKAGAVICNCTDPLPLDDNNWACPIQLI
jgi:predicted AAA+ superfamily ATPase